MHIVIQSRDFPLTDALHRHTRRKVVNALRRLSEEITNVDVTLEDTNGPRGGADKRCLIRVSGRRLPQLISQHVDKDMYKSISTAATRVGRVLQRRLHRRNARQRRTPYMAAMSTQ